MFCYTVKVHDRGMLSTLQSKALQSMTSVGCVVLIYLASGEVHDFLVHEAWTYMMSYVHSDVCCKNIMDILLHAWEDL